MSKVTKVTGETVNILGPPRVYLPLEVALAMADDGPKDEGDILYTRANLLNPLLCAREIARFLHASTPLTLGEPAIKDLATIIARHIIVGSPVK